MCTSRGRKGSERGGFVELRGIEPRVSDHRRPGRVEPSGYGIFGCRAFQFSPVFMGGQFHVLPRTVLPGGVLFVRAVCRVSCAAQRTNHVVDLLAGHHLGEDAPV